MTPTVSAYAHIFGPFDYNHSPLKPLGCHVQIHNKPSNRKLWDMHSNDGFYLESSMDHYRADKCFDRKTKAVRVSNTVPSKTTASPSLASRMLTYWSKPSETSLIASKV